MVIKVNMSCKCVAVVRLQMVFSELLKSRMQTCFRDGACRCSDCKAGTRKPEAEPYRACPHCPLLGKSALGFSGPCYYVSETCGNVSVKFLMIVFVAAIVGK